MAAPRDQAARMLRPEPEQVEAAPRRENSAAPAEQLRGQVAEESKRRPAETPVAPVVDKPVTAPANSAAPNSANRKKLVLMGVGALVALALASYGVHYLLVGRFYVSTDDAYVRANNTTLGAR
ncbi:MAG: HlyD family secretion protein, partial [Alphaproteobacteria bacterium]